MEKCARRDRGVPRAREFLEAPADLKNYSRESVISVEDPSRECPDVPDEAYMCVRVVTKKKK